MKVLVLNPDGTASTEDAPDDDHERLTWLQAKVGGYIEHVTYLKMIEVGGVLTRERGSMFVNEEGAIGEPLPFNFLATLLYLEASRQRGDIKGESYPAVIHGVAVVMPEAET